jgi:methylmalonyl-CoA/ethylmalonyl-CoA epimerase
MGTISHIDHIAIVVNSIEEVRPFYEDALGLRISHSEEMPRRGIKTAFITIGQTKIELIESLNDESEISNFIKKRGPGLHHIAFKTSDISLMAKKLGDKKVVLTYDQPQSGAHNTLVNFIHPKSTGGTLLEIVE